jgi:hypothetical protein
MPKQVDLAREAITPQLQPDEQLRTVGYFRTGPFWAMILLSSWFTFAMKYYYVGVTNKRLIFIQLTAWGKPDAKKVTAVSLYDVELKGSSLLVKNPDKPKPTRYDMQFGIEKISGFNSQDFKAAFPIN